MNAFRTLVVSLLGVGAIALAGLTGGCGKHIGDSCFVNSDCDTAGERICDNAATGGYCTILGCDYNTCPEESVCISFYAGVFDNKPCNAATEDALAGGTDDCTLDEVCTLAGKCAVRTTEVRYCMLSCGSSGDCRDDYECRNEALMIANGGEPVIGPDQSAAADSYKFCAQAP